MTGRIGPLRPSSWVLGLALVASPVLAPPRAQPVTEPTSPSRTVEAPRLAHAGPRWWSFSDAPIVLNSQGAAAMLVATSWRFRTANGRGWGASVPSGAVGFEVDLRRTARAGAKCGYPLRPSREFPATKSMLLREASLRRGPSDDNPKTVDFRYAATVRGMYHLLLTVEYGSPAPPASLKHKLDAALQAVVLPTWPRGC